MSFIAPVMAFGVIAFSIPLVIHLLNRSRYRTVKWGAMHLLESVIRKNRKRIQLEQLLLLLVRMAIPAAIALFMARPVLTGFRSLPGDVQSSLVCVLDDSYSMEAGDPSNFKIAKDAVQGIVAGLKEGSDASVQLMGTSHTEPVSRPTVALERLSQKLIPLESGYGLAEVGRSLETGIATLSAMHHEKRDVIVASDFQRVSWSARNKGDYQRIAELVQRVPVKPYLTLFHTGRPYKENVAVETLDFSSLVVGTGQEIQVKAVLKNFGTGVYRGLRVHFRADGSEREMTEITLEKNERKQVLFSHSFTEPGSHYVEVFTDADSLEADNTLYAAIEVWDKVPVLIVSGEESSVPLMGESDYLQIALQPFTSGSITLTDLIKADVVEEKRFSAKALKEYQVVVLANVSRLNEKQFEGLKQFVGTGGGLLVFPGGRCDSAWYNEVMAGGGNSFERGNRLIPLGLFPLDDASVSAARQENSKTGTSILGQHYDHEALSLFNIPDNGDLTNSVIYRWYKLKEVDRLRSSGDRVHVLAKLATGDPFLVEKPFEEGRVILCATACDAQWSNLPLRPFYLPLMQQLVTYLASTVYPPRNIEVGKPIVVLPGERAAEKELMVTLPGGYREKLELVKKGNLVTASCNNTARPGLYTVEGKGIGPIHFVVRTDRIESMLEQLSEEEIRQTAKDLGGDAVFSLEEYRTLESERTHGRGIWRYLFWAAVALLFSEMLLQLLFSRKRTGRAR